jgi:hypothetical protein
LTENNSKIATGSGLDERPRLVPPDGPRSRQAHQRHPARDPDDGTRSRSAEAEAAFATVRQECLQTAAFDPRVDLLEQAVEGRRNEPREHSAAGGEAPVRAHQMLAARAHGR